MRRSQSLVPAVIVLALALLAGCGPVVARPSAEAVMYRHDARRTGVYDTTGVPTLSGLKWKFQTGDAIWSSLVVAQGVVYLGSDDNFFYAVDAQSGEQKWRFETDGDVRSSAAVAEGVVYFGSFDGYVYAVDAVSGQEVWKVQVMQPREERGVGDDHTSSPAVVNGVVYVGSLDRQCLHALDARTGQRKWVFAPDDAELVNTPPAISGDTVYFGGALWGTVYALDVRTGEQKWTFRTRGPVDYAPVIGDDGTVYVSSTDGTLYALDGQTGQEKWRINWAEVSRVSGSLALANGMVYVGQDIQTVSRLLAVDTATGQEVWRFDTGGGYEYSSSSPAYVDGILYVGSGSGKVYAVEAQTGQEVWQFEAGGLITSSPAVADGVVYFGSEDGYLYAVN
jgi:outer membrane protein assembly factor BamB